MLLSRYLMNLNDQALDDNTTKAVPYKHKGVFLAQLPLGTVDQDQTSTTLNNHIIAMCGLLSTINMLRSMLIANLVHPTSSSICLLYFSPQQLLLAHKHLKKNNLQLNLQFGSKLLAHWSSTKACFKKLQHI